MSWLDLVIVAVVAWTTLSAFRAGLIREAVTLLGLILGAVLAGQFYDRLSANIEFAIDHRATRNLVSFFAIFGGIQVIAQVGAAMLSGTAKVLFLGPLDHLGGALFGLLKGLLFVEVVLIASQTFTAAQWLNAAIEESTLAPFFLDVAPIVEGLLPAEFGEAVQRFQDGLQLPVLPPPLPR